MNGYLSITELSRHKSITTETLRHYDRIGLFKPDYVDPQTSYRYYSYRQCEKIGTIIELRNLGLSLKELQEYLNNRNIESSYKLLTGKSMEIAETIRKLKAIQLEIHAKVESLKAAMEADENVRVKYSIFPDRYVLTAPQYRTNMDEYLYDLLVLEEELKGKMPVFATDHIGALIDKESLKEYDSVISRAACVRAEKILKNYPREKLTKIPGGQYLVFSGRGWFRTGCSGVKELLDYLDHEGLTIKNDVVEYCRVDMDVTDKEEEMVYTLEIMI